jgi:2,3-bisphosphoglycerate-independent phosphoglycerate mutase
MHACHVFADEMAAKVCLVVIDGWGLSSEEKGNAILHADTPVMDRLSKGEDGGSMEVEASGLAVGLPAGLMGNSEVGHYTIGTGRVTFQDIVAINFAVEKKTLSSRSNLMKAFQRAKNGNGRLHFLGLVSDGGVHSHINHLFALLEEAKKAEVPKAFIHFFSDGRDTSPTSGGWYGLFGIWCCIEHPVLPSL